MLFGGQSEIKHFIKLYFLILEDSITRLFMAGISEKFVSLIYNQNCFQCYKLLEFCLIISSPIQHFSNCIVYRYLEVGMVSNSTN